VQDAAGKVAAQILTACPPGIPLVVPGELIDEPMPAALKNSGILSVNVVQ
jgi:arginine/lysine/ornithine decarboxylase